MRLLGIKLLGRTGSNSDFVEFDLRKVNFVDLYRPTEHSSKVPAYHTPDGSYLALYSLKDIAAGYERYGFKRYGASTVINEKRIARKDVENSQTVVTFLCGSRVKVRKK